MVTTVAPVRAPNFLDDWVRQHGEQERLDTYGPPPAEPVPVHKPRNARRYDAAAARAAIADAMGVPSIDIDFEDDVYTYDPVEYLDERPVKHVPPTAPPEAIRAAKDERNARDRARRRKRFEENVRAGQTHYGPVPKGR